MLRGVVRFGFPVCVALIVFACTNDHATQHPESATGRGGGAEGGVGGTGGMEHGSAGTSGEPGAACNGSPEEEEVVLEAPAEIRSNVHVLPDDVAEQVIIEGDTLSVPGGVWPEAADLQTGDVLVSSFSDGFIRRVLSAPVKPQLRLLAASTGAFFH